MKPFFTKTSKCFIDKLFTVALITMEKGVEYE